MPVQCISVVGTKFFHGIARLCEAVLCDLERDRVAKQIEESPRHDENAYCISICTLASASIESAVTRLLFLENRRIDFKKVEPFKWLGEIYPKKLFVADELAFIRGAILHNHLYQMEQNWSDETPSIKNIRKRPASGDGKYENNVDPISNKTKCLKINAVPSRIRFIDMIIFLNATSDLLNLMEKRSNNELGFSSSRVELGSDRGLTLENLVAVLCKRLTSYDPTYEIDSACSISQVSASPNIK